LKVYSVALLAVSLCSIAALSSVRLTIALSVPLRVALAILLCVGGRHTEGAPVAAVAVAVVAVAVPGVVGSVVDRSRVVARAEDLAVSGLGRWRGGLITRTLLAICLRSLSIVVLLCL